MTGENPPRDVHIPVLVEQVLWALQSVNEGLLFDGTVGAGGHAFALLNRKGTDCRLYGLDRDPEILVHAQNRLSIFEGRVDLRQGSYDEVDTVFPELTSERPRGVLLDLGVSSLQLDDGRRGFSFDSDGPLDMRMDPSQSLTAATIVNEWPREELEKVFREYGEEPKARAVARAIDEARRRMPLRSTGALSALLERVLPKGGKRHPATRIFQGLRIAVNRELERLTLGLDKGLDLLDVGGRMAVISFHSLEDRIVKNRFRDRAKSGGWEVLTKKPLSATPEESRRNRRSRSAKLRAVQRLA